MLRTSIKKILSQKMIKNDFLNSNSTDWMKVLKRRQILHYLIENSDIFSDKALLYKNLLELIDIEKQIGNVDEIQYLNSRWQKIKTRMLLKQKDSQMKEASLAEDSQDYEKAYEIYNLCFNISKELYENGERGEEVYMKHFQQLAESNKKK